ncbi:MAG: hypothetical protein OXF02_06935, partial [Simkaniaceae bacterium]|nr:hypothetical protein [Simkaniaceae bacterium]
MFRKNSFGVLSILFFFPLFTLSAETKTMGGPYYVYMSGKVRKGAEVRTQKDWRRYYLENLKRKDVKLLTPERLEDGFRRDLIVGRDAVMVRDADLILVDGSIRLGAGTAHEIPVGKD